VELAPEAVEMVVVAIFLEFVKTIVALSMYLYMVVVVEGALTAAILIIQEETDFQADQEVVAAVVTQKLVAAYLWSARVI
jgi:hypothetical protein